MNQHKDLTEAASRVEDGDTGHRQQSTTVNRQARDNRPSEGTTSQEPPDRLGRYVLQKSLGQGAMGTVYLAMDTTLERPVAVKIPRFDRVSPEHIARFYREARTMAAISHRNLCTVYDVSQIEGFHCLTMEYLQGEPLSDVLDREQRLDSLHAVKLIRSLCDGLQLAHDAGVVHRDIKPANVIIDDNGQPVLTDFGLARRFDEQPSSCSPHVDTDDSDSSHDEDGSITLAGAILGTPTFMAPEQADPARADQIGACSDVYSLGVLLYRMICGRTPFKGRMSRVIRALLHDTPEPPGQHCRDIDPRLERMILKALEKQPADRFASAAEFGTELSNYLLSLDDAATRRRRNRILGLAVPVLIVAALVPVALRKPAETTDSEPPQTPLIDSAQLLESGVQNAIQFADIDLDGDADVLSVGTMKDLGRIWLNDGHGRLQEAPQRFGTGRHFATGDLNGDGAPDAFIAGGSSPDSIWVNDGNGHFANSGQELPSRSSHVSLEDLDGDGDLDAFLGAGDSVPMHNLVLLNDGHGAFTDSGQRLGESETVMTALADIDGDDDLDAITASNHDGKDSLWLNDGSGTYTRGEQEFDHPSTQTLAAGDIDNDGDIDLVFAIDHSALTIWTNDGLGRFMNNGQSFNPGSTSTLLLADIDGDGDLDAVTANRKAIHGREQSVRGAPNAVWWNNGRAQFKSSWQFGNGATRHIAAKDVDGDGDIDLLELDGDDEGTIHLLLNQQVPSAAEYDPTKTADIPDISFELPTQSGLAPDGEEE